MSKRDEMAHEFVNECPKYSGYPAHEETYKAAWDAAIQNDERVLALGNAVTDFFHLMNQGLLVRDTSNDHDPNWALKAMSLVAKLKSADEALTQWNKSTTKKREE